MAGPRTRRTPAARSTKYDVDGIYSRINDLTSRVVALETHQPHTEAQLTRIEKDIGGIKEMLSRVMWVIVLAVVGALLKIVLPGIGP